MTKSKKRKVMPIDRHVARKIYLRRKLLGLSQSNLADAVNLSFQQIQKYEQGDNRITIGVLSEIANILEVPINYFCEGFPTTKSSDPKNDIEDFIYNDDALKVLRKYVLLTQCNPANSKIINSIMDALINNQTTSD